jgi:DNA (cytosine-5)-methyltransferase 1
MKYASVCSGVEAASLAWESLGWKPVWFSEIEPFPCEVLKQRFPNVPNLGDMTKIKVEKLDNGDQKYTNGMGTDVIVPGGVDLLVGGTPCQSFSVAGKREGLEGASGLARTFVELLGAMQPRWFVWENVPGCLSSRSNGGVYDFNFLLASFAERGYSCAWRVLDAQYVRVDGYPRAVPQRRRRVFVVGHLGDQWEYPAKVLFEQQSVLGDTPPCRVKGKGFTADAEGSVGDADKHYRIITPNGKDCADTIDASYYKGVGSRNGNERTVVCLNDQGGSVMAVEENGNAGTLRANTHGNEQIVCGSFVGQAGAKTHSIGYAEEISGSLSVGHLTDVLCCENHANDSRVKEMGESCQTLNSRMGTGGGNLPLVQEYYDWHSQNVRASKIEDDCSPTNPAAMGMGGASMTTPLLIKECYVVDQGAGKSSCSVSENISPTLATTHGGEPAVQVVHGAETPISNSEHANPVTCNHNGLENCVAIAENIIGRSVETGGNGVGAQEELAYTQNATGVMGVANNATVRRLLPIECERLMGFPDNHTRISWKGKSPEECPDAPRYKACGNSMAVNVMRWIGMRIDEVDKMESVDK